MRTLFLLLCAWIFSAPIHAADLRPEPDPASERSFVPPIPESWARVPGPYAQLVGEEADQATLLHLAQHAAEAVPRLAEVLGVPAVPMTVIVAPDDRAFRAMQPGSVPVWADGTAWPGLGLVYLRAPGARPGTSAPLTQVLEHEVIHILLGRAFGERPVPTWLQEGLAKLLAREITLDMNEALADGALSGQLLSLDELTGPFPKGTPGARLAYAQSAYFMAFVRNTWGPEAIHELVASMASGDSVEDALRAATGQPPDAVEAAWRARLDASPLWLSALARSPVWFALAAVVFVIGGVRRIRRSRARLARWEEQERAQDALLEALRLQRAWPEPPQQPPLLH